MNLDKEVYINSWIDDLCNGKCINLLRSQLSELIDNMDKINILMIQKSIDGTYWIKADDITVRDYKIANREQYYDNCKYYEAIETDYDVYSGHSHYDSYCNFDNKHKRLNGCEERICKKCENFLDNSDSK